MRYLPSQETKKSLGAVFMQERLKPASSHVLHDLGGASQHGIWKTGHVEHLQPQMKFGIPSMLGKNCLMCSMQWNNCVFQTTGHLTPFCRQQPFLKETALLGGLAP